MMRAAPQRLWTAPHRRAARGNRGIASIEAALAISLVLVPVCLGVIELGVALAAVERLDSAVQAAAFYAWANQGTPSGWGSLGSASLAGAQSAAAAAYGTSGPAATITASVAFYCVANGYSQVQPAVTDATACPAGESLAVYLTTAASTSVSVPGMAHTTVIPLSVSGTVRVQ